MSAKKRLQKFIVFLSALSFLGSTGYSLAQMFRQGMQPLDESAPDEVESLQQAQGYERVLQRESNNVVELEQEEEYQAILALVQEMLEGDRSKTTKV